MVYELHIKRTSPITSDEWLSAVETIDDLKIDETDWVTTNPLTGKQIRIPGAPGTAALWFSEIGEWIKTFEFRRGRISFNAKAWDNPQMPVRAKSFEIARKLNAEIVGDEGEIYTESK
jgi:hypothetical protein